MKRNKAAKEDELFGRGIQMCELQWQTMLNGKYIVLDLRKYVQPSWKKYGEYVLNFLDNATRRTV